MVLLAVGAGAIAVMPLAGRLCDRFGSRPTPTAAGSRLPRTLAVAPAQPAPALGPAVAPGPSRGRVPAARGP